MSWQGDVKVLLVIGGGISAYRVCDVGRSLRKMGFQVKAHLTEGASPFVPPLVVSALIEDRCTLEEEFLGLDWGHKIPHIRLARWADLLVFVPATASVIARLAHGDASTFYGALALAYRGKVLLFPAMNAQMLEHPATRANLELCRSYGYEVVEPDEGLLACDEYGKGKLPPVEVVVDEICRAAYPDKRLKGRKVLVTGGPTREFIDSVRFISNPSSGSMGVELARFAAYMGADVTLVLGPTDVRPPSYVHTIRVESALQMFEVVSSLYREFDLVVKAAAVSDYRVSSPVKGKLKREGAENLVVELVQNPDIAAYLGSHRRPGQVLVGFAAEWDLREEEVLRKLRKKGLDMIVANDVSSGDAGFSSDLIRGRMYFSSGKEPVELGTLTKGEAARLILEEASLLLG